MGREGQNELFFFFGSPIIEIETLPHTMVLRQTSNHHHCRDFQVILSSSSCSKTTLGIFKEQIWLPNRKCYRKNMKCYEQAPLLPLESKYISLKQTDE